jgi:hypothetical protein
LLIGSNYRVAVDEAVTVGEARVASDEPYSRIARYRNVVALGGLIAAPVGLQTRKRMKDTGDTDRRGSAGPGWDVDDVGAVTALLRRSWVPIRCSA